MIVCIAEKPSVAKDIARILGATQQHQGYMEGNGYQVTWTFGHLCELKEPHDYTEAWKRWSLSSLPMIPAHFGIKLIDDAGIRKQFEVIKKLYSQADEIINCGDAGQEGELIQRWVIQMANTKCPIKRLWISSMTDEAIREGFQNLKEQNQYESLYYAGLSRAIGDWLLGMNATRLYTLKFGKNRQVLSIGRVQTPTLALIVKRQKEIDQFKPEPYWVLSTIYRDTLFTATKGRFSSKEEGQEAFKDIQDKPFVVNSVTKKKGTESPKQLYDLTSLQVDCNKKFGFSAEMTLNTIQQLYEKKLTTYPRVDTQYLSDDIYPKCPQIMNGLFQVTKTGKQPYAEFVKTLGGKPLAKSKRVFDSSKVTDHHAIIPTGVQPQGLTDAEQHVYHLIALRFISVFYPDCRFATTTVLGKAGNVEFKATGKEIIEPGWHVVYQKEKTTTDEAPQINPASKATESILPSFSKGEQGLHTPTLTEKQTTPPKPYTEATLLRAMETAGKFVDNDELRAALKENGIGRPSSRASIIETLFKRHYIQRQKKNIIATPMGIALVDTIHEKLLTSPELTGIWEKKLRDIEHHKYDAATFINELKEQITRVVSQVLSSPTVRIDDIPAEAPAKTKRQTTSKKRTKKATVTTLDIKEGDICPVCHQGHIIKGNTAYGCSRWKEGCTFRQPFSTAQGNEKQ